MASRLARVSGQDVTYRPHLTLQGVYDGADLDQVTAAVRGVAVTTAPFTVDVEGVGLLTVTLRPEDALLAPQRRQERAASRASYGRVKEALSAQGMQTYPYTREQWVPHLTLASGTLVAATNWTSSLRHLQPDIPGCILPVADVSVNRREESGLWTLVERCPFASPRQ